MMNEKKQGSEPEFVCEQLKCLCRYCAGRYAIGCPW